MTLQKLATILIIIVTLQNPLWAKEEEMPVGFVDDSVRDMSIVFGSGLVGAGLGLSTLSFVDEPSKHLKAISVGGALGVVIGVAIVVFNQAQRTTLGDLPVRKEEKLPIYTAMAPSRGFMGPSFTYQFSF